MTTQLIPIDGGDAKPNASYVPVDPTTARRWLEGNTVNRSVRAAKVAQYARDMAAGRWQLSNDAISFNPEGKLLNGQHRLNAVVKADTTIVFLVVRNMPTETMTTMDAGAARTASDALGLKGERNRHALAAVTRLCKLYSEGLIYRDNKYQTVSHGEIMEFLSEHPSVRETVTNAARTARSIEASPSPVLAAHWIIATVNAQDVATRFLHQVATRVNEPEGSAVLAIDSRLREIRRNSTRVENRNLLYLFVKGWNYYARGEKVKTLAIKPKVGKEFRIPDPVRIVPW